jgi:type IV pilus assembly protein PilW
MTGRLREKSGFSMVELLVAVAIGAIVIAVIAAAFWVESQTSRTQQMSVQMQQNIRAGMFFMERDIMMAGYGDDPSNPSGATITIANPTTLAFTFTDPICVEDNVDNDKDGTVDEALEKDGIDDNDDGETDEVNELDTIRFSLTGTDLHRIIHTGAFQVDEIIALNIQTLEFFYTLEDGTSTTNVATAKDRDDIRKIGISILAQTELEARGYTDTQIYHPLSGADWGPYNDNFRREIVTTTVQCRNML